MTLSELLTNLTTAVTNRALSTAPLDSEAIRLLEWHIYRARSAIHNHVARSISRVSREEFESGQEQGAAPISSATMQAHSDARRARNARHDARILGQG